MIYDTVQIKMIWFGFKFFPNIKIKNIKLIPVLLTWVYNSSIERQTDQMFLIFSKNVRNAFISNQIYNRQKSNSVKDINYNIKAC